MQMNNLNVAKIQLNGGPYEINTGTNLIQLLNNFSSILLYPFPNIL